MSKGFATENLISKKSKKKVISNEPKGIILLLLVVLNLLKDFIPKIIGITAAWIWANNKIEKNKINSKIN